MTGYSSKRKYAFWKISAAISLAGVLLLPRAVSAEEQTLSWARIDFLRNQVQLVPQNERARNARISDFLSIGDALRTARSARAELRFNDGSLARIGERATFRFTPNTRNFQLTNGTVLLLIPPERGRSTIQTPNAVTGIQGSALFVRYIPETDTTIVGALTDNPNGPMVLFNRDGSERQALQANQIGVIENDQIIQIFEFDSELFWQTSGLAQGFDYMQGASVTGSDALDAVRQEIRDAIAKQGDFINDNRVIENPPAFTRPDSPEGEDVPASEETGEATPDSSQETDTDSDSASSVSPETSDSDAAPDGSEANDGLTAADSAAEEELEFEGSAAEAYLSEPEEALAGSPPSDSATSSEIDEVADDRDSADEATEDIPPLGTGEANPEQGASSDLTEADPDRTELSAQSTDSAEDILSVDDSQDSESAIDDSAAPTQLPGRIRRNGDSNDTPAVEETGMSTAGTETAPAPVAPGINSSTSLEPTAESNRSGPPSLPQGAEAVPSVGGFTNATGPAAADEGIPANVPSAPGLLPTNVTIPDLNEQEMVPLGQGVPLQPELRMVDDRPNPVMRQPIADPPEPTPAELTPAELTPPEPTENVL